MKKTITKILLASIILFGFGNINQTNAGDLDGLEEIFNQQDEFSCIVIDREITHYPRYKGMIDNYFRKISTKSYAYRKNIYTKLDILTTRKLTTINKTRQERIYAIIGYIKCESNNKLDDLINDNNYSYKLDKIGYLLNLYAIDGGETFFVDSVDGKINNIHFLGKFLIYDWISTGGTVRKAYDMEFKKKVGGVRFGKHIGNNIIYGCNVEGYGPGSVQVLNLNTKEFKNLKPSNLNVYSCLLKGKSLYFTLQDNNSNKEHYKYDLLKLELYVNAKRFNDLGWESIENVFPSIYIKDKKGTFIKYIGGGVEARQNKLYTYFYYNGKLINTVKNKINKDAILLDSGKIGLLINEDGYLNEYSSKRKLDLYSASLENNGKRIFFVKKTDNGKINFAYDLETGKLEDWTFEY